MADEHATTILELMPRADTVTVRPTRGLATAARHAQLRNAAITSERLPAGLYDQTRRPLSADLAPHEGQPLKAS
jgi:hypothetical protein